MDQLGGPTKVAEFLGVSRTTLHNWIKREVRLPFDVAEQLAHAAGVSLDWVATGKADPESAGDSPAVWLRPLDGGNNNPHVPIPRAALEQRAPNLATLSALRVTGRELEPFVRAGDIVVVDTADRDLSEAGGRSYVVRRGTLFSLVRAMRLVNGSVEISTEVPKRTEQVHPADIERVDVVGRVILALSEP